MRTDSPVEAPPSRPFRDEDTVGPLHRSVRDWRSIVRDAYALQPTLSLTSRQAQRLWGMDGPTCRDVLDGLVDAGVLVRSADEQYCRSDYAGTVDPVGMS